jgi:hypothetical protein
MDKNNFLAKSLEVCSQPHERQDDLLQACHAINNDGGGEMCHHQDHHYNLGLGRLTNNVRRLYH